MDPLDPDASVTPLSVGPALSGLASKTKGVRMLSGFGGSAGSFPEHSHLVAQRAGMCGERRPASGYSARSASTG